MLITSGATGGTAHSPGYSAPQELDNMDKGNLHLTDKSLALTCSRGASGNRMLL